MLCDKRLHNKINEFDSLNSYLNILAKVSFKDMHVINKLWKEKDSRKKKKNWTGLIIAKPAIDKFHHLFTFKLYVATDL